MSKKVVVMTKDLISILEVLKITAEQKGEVPEINGVWLYSTRGEYGEEPGQVDLLAGMSTDYTVAGHTYVPVEGGDLGDGFFLPLDELKAAEMRMKSVTEEEHVMEIELDPVDEMVTIREYDKDDGFNHRFPLVEVDFPADAVKKWVNGTSSPLQDEMNQPLSDGKVMVLDTQAISTIIKVAKKKKVSGIPTVKVHRGAVHSIALGDDWRGAMLPNELVITYDADELEAEHYLP